MCGTSWQGGHALDRCCIPGNRVRVSSVRAITLMVPGKSGGHVQSQLECSCFVSGTLPPGDVQHDRVERRRGRRRRRHRGRVLPGLQAMARAVDGRGLHSSTFQLNLSRF